MKIVIDKDKELQKLKDMLPNLTDKKDVQSVKFAINVIEGIDGTPLPKGHGRLIDADAITKDVETLQNSFVINMDNMTGKILGCECLAPTIIEGSDKE